MSRLFKAWLRGSHEVPSVSTDAFGKALFKFKRVNGHIKLFFLIKVRHIDKIRKIDLHLGSRGNNGPRIATLFGPTCPGISVNRGVISGRLSACDLVGPLCGHSLFKLFKLFLKGKVYVNVHTSEHPRGEIRGQVLAVSTRRHHRHHHHHCGCHRHHRHHHHCHHHHKHCHC